MQRVFLCVRISVSVFRAIQICVGLWVCVCLCVCIFQSEIGSGSISFAVTDVPLCV